MIGRPSVASASYPTSCDLDRTLHTHEKACTACEDTNNSAIQAVVFTVSLSSKALREKALPFQR